MKVRKPVTSLCAALLTGSTLVSFACASSSAVDPNNPTQGRPLEMLSGNNQEIQAHPRQASLYVDRSDTYMLMGRFNEAIEDANTALELDPQEETAYGKRGQVRLKMKEYKLALNDLNRAIQMDALNPDFYHARAEVYNKMGRSDLAAKDNQQSTILGYGAGGPDFKPYMADLQRRIKRAWFPPKGNESKKVVVQFWLDRNGNESELKVEQTSGVPAADAAALKAVTNASPFRPLPRGSARRVPISFTFDYNVFGSHGQIWSLNKPGALPVAQTKTYATFSPSSDRSSDWGKVESDLEKQLAEAAKKGDELQLVPPLLSLGDGYREHGKYDQAESSYKRAQAILQKQNKQDNETVLVMGRLAGIYAAQGKSTEAESLYKQALELADQTKDKQVSQNTREIITAYAKLLYKTSRFDEANKLYSRLKE